MALSIPDQLKQLDSARQIVLGDAALYPQIVTHILPIVGAGAQLELRRWGANFLAETFGSPVVPAKSKEQMGITALQTMKEILESSGAQDTEVVKGIIQASASIYDPIFKYIVENPSDIPVWNNMAAIKSNILKRWDGASTGVRICCIKFVQKVVQVQTPGVVTDPRRMEKNETSIAMVPRDHPLIPPPRLEPEASGLLDRLLDVFQQDTSDAVLIDATLNCLNVLLRTRQTIANKIVSAILNFNPLKRANSPMTPRIKIQIKSMERTTRALLLNVYRRNENSPLAPRIKQYVDRMMQSRIEIFDEATSRKRGLQEPTDGLDTNKRRRLGADVQSSAIAPPKLHGPCTVAQLFTLTPDQTLASFDARQLPEHLVIAIANALLGHVTQPELEQAVNQVRARLLSVEKASNGPVLGDDDEDYEPDYAPNEDREQLLNRADALPPNDAYQAEDLALGTFTLPQPPPISRDEAGEIARTTVDRVFGMVTTADEPSPAKRRPTGMNRLAGSNHDRDAWITLIARIATRGSISSLNHEEAESNGGKDLVKAGKPSTDLSDTIRENLWKYIMDDFRARMSIAIAWLNEEWFNDAMQRKAYESRGKENERQPSPKQHYDPWTLRILDSILPYIDAKDKLLIRFLSEIPTVSKQVLERVKSLARDPERVDLAVKALQYLIIFKPPARELCIDALEDLWRNYDDARVPTTKLLQRWRPHILSAAAPPQIPNSSAAEPKDPRSPPPSTSDSSSVRKSEDIQSPTTGQPVAAAG